MPSYSNRYFPAIYDKDPEIQENDLGYKSIRPRQIRFEGPANPNALLGTVVAEKIAAWLESKPSKTEVEKAWRFIIAAEIRSGHWETPKTLSDEESGQEVWDAIRED